MGVSPIAGSAGIHGFDLVNDSPAYEYSTSAMVTGKVYAANYKDPTPAKLTKAISHMEAAFTTSMGKPAPDFVEYKTGLLEGSVLVPGLYKWALDISFSTSLTFSGTTSDTWLLQVSRNVYVGVGANVVLAGGAKAINIFWVVQGLVAIGRQQPRRGDLSLRHRHHLCRRSERVWSVPCADRSDARWRGCYGVGRI
jgi:hypothetical protein